MTTKYQHRPAVELYDVLQDPYCQYDLSTNEHLNKARSEVDALAVREY